MNDANPIGKTTFKDRILIERLFIANRGEIACRIIKAAHNNRITSIACYSRADENSEHVALADEAVEIGPARASESYLNIDRVVNAALQMEADALHPGYGFLSENSDLALRCEQAGIEFVGPHSETIRAMASKSAAADVAMSADVPVLPGYRGENQDLDSILEASTAIGYPVLLKSALGGGGRGMRIVSDHQQFKEAFIAAQSESREAFGNEQIIVEKFLPSARHIEVQIIGDKHGNLFHLFTRDCSAQRRYQKIVEEAPAPNIPHETREQIQNAAVRLGKALSYYSTGTVEFLYDGTNYYFMEMNTRLQVEHPVTEMITSVDLVDLQFQVANGESLDKSNLPSNHHGHAIEVRIYAENPSKGFMPSPGKLDFLDFPKPTKRFRVDSGVKQGDYVQEYYDPMIAKFITFEPTRDKAIQSMESALGNTLILGVDSNIRFLSNLLNHDSFRNDNIDINFVEFHSDELAQNEDLNEILVLSTLHFHFEKNSAIQTSTNQFSPWNLTYGWRSSSYAEAAYLWGDDEQVIQTVIREVLDDVKVQIEQKTFDCKVLEINNTGIKAEINGKLLEAHVYCDGKIAKIFCRCSYYELRLLKLDVFAKTTTQISGSLSAPLPGRVSRVLVKTGDRVTAGECLIVIDAMKMEHQLNSPVDGIVSAINYQADDQVEEGATCVVVEPDQEDGAQIETSES